MNRWICFSFLTFWFLFANDLWAQGHKKNVIDDIQIDVKSVKTSGADDTLSIELFLISYQRNPREFKLNTFATQIVDSDGNKHLFTSIKMGRVSVQLSDRQNYLHYLLEEDVPVPLTIYVEAWKGTNASKVILVYEDSTEEGKFLTQEILLP